MLVRMTEEPEDYEGPWPSEDAMTKPTVDEVMGLVKDYACRSFIPGSGMKEAHDKLRAALESLIAPAILNSTMTDEEARAFQNWAGMDGASAWALIARHAEGWAETGQMMNAWLDANRAAPELKAPLSMDGKSAAPQQAEPVAQIGWADEFGNLFPMGAWKPTQRTHHDSHKAAWRAVYLHPPAAEVQRLRDALRVILEADWTSDRIRNIARKALEGGA